MKRLKLFVSLFATAFVLSLATTALAALTVSVSVNPDPVRPGETANVEFTVTNTGASAESNLTLETVVPSEIADTLHQSLVTGGATCPGGWCSPGDTITWAIGSPLVVRGRRFHYHLSLRVLSPMEHPSHLRVL